MRFGYKMEHVRWQATITKMKFSVQLIIGSVSELSKYGTFKYAWNNEVATCDSVHKNFTANSDRQREAYRECADCWKLVLVPGVQLVEDAAPHVMLLTCRPRRLHLFHFNPEKLI